MAKEVPKGDAFAVPKVLVWPKPVPVVDWPNNGLFCENKPVDGVEAGVEKANPVFWGVPNPVVWGLPNKDPAVL